MENDIKELGLKALLEKGDVEGFLTNKIKTEESSQKGQLIGSFARIADLMTQHSEGVMVEAVTSRIVKALSKLAEELSDSVQKDMKEVAKELEKFTTTQNEKAKRDIVARIETKLIEIEDAIKSNSDGLLREFFDEALPDLKENARVTPEELATMEQNTKEAVKQQLPKLIRAYFSEVYVTPAQIKGFEKAVKKLIPEQEKFDIAKEKIDWNQLKNVPEGVTRTGGIVTKAIEWINGIDLSTTPTNGQSLTYDSTTKTWKPGSGGTGDMLAATYDAAGKAEQVLTESDILDEDNMAQNSATKVPSQQSTKAYVDTAVGGKQDTITFGTGVETALGVNVGSAGAPVVNGGALGTPSSGTLTNCSGLPLSGVTDSTSEALGVGTLELGHASDTTLSRASAGVLAVEGVSVLTTAGGTLTGNINLGEGADPADKGIVIDSSLSADERYSGITVPGTAGATLAFGDICYLDATAGEWLLADASAVGTAGDVPLGICVDASTDGAATSMLMVGTVRSAAFPASIALGAPLYVSETAGDITSTAPTTTDSVMRRVGFAVTTEPNTVYFNPSSDYVTHT